MIVYCNKLECPSPRFIKRTMCWRIYLQQAQKNKTRISPLDLIQFLKHLNFNKPWSSIQSVPGGKVNILGGHSIGHSKQKCLYEHVSYSERFPR